METMINIQQLSKQDRELMEMHNTCINQVIDTKEDEIKIFIENEIEKVAHLINDEKYVEREMKKGMVYLQIIHKMIDAHNKDKALDEYINQYMEKHDIYHIIDEFERDIRDAKRYYIIAVKNAQNIKTNFDNESSKLASSKLALLFG